MHFQVDQGILQSALQAATRAVSSRTTLPVLTGILLEAGTGKLLISATDLEIAIQTAVVAEVEEEGALVLPARYLSEFVRRVPHGTIQVSVPEGAFKATLRWERSEYVIQGFPAEQFPSLGHVEGAAIAIPQPLLRQMLRQTSFAVSADETKPALTGVHITLDDGRALALATDGFRVAVRRAQLEGSGRMDVILPGRSLNELARLLGDEDEADSRFSAGESQAEFDLGRARVVSRLIEGRYPDVLSLLPSEYPIRVVTDRAALQDAVERASLLADARQSTRPLIILEAGGDRLVITASDPEVGQAYEEVAAETSGGEIRIGLNARFLLEGLRHVDGDSLSLEFIDSAKAVRLTRADGDNCAGEAEYEYVVFPVRL